MPWMFLSDQGTGSNSHMKTPSEQTTFPANPLPFFSVATTNRGDDEDDRFDDCGKREDKADRNN